MRKAFSWEPDINDVRRNLIREMNRAGAVRLEGEYSGGHDSGGLDYFGIFDKDGNSIDRSGMDLNGLHAAVNELLSTKFYSWALEGYVNGQVYVDLREKRAWTEGVEEMTEYVPDADPIDLTW